jgi:hypothetical protein
MRNDKNVIEQDGSNGAASLLVFGEYPLRLSTETQTFLRFFVVYAAALSEVPVIHPVLKSENWRQQCFGTEVLQLQR